MKTISLSETQTAEIARDFAVKLVGGDIVLLDGFLGAGKTAFTKGIALGLGVAQDITSPTFTIMNEYNLASGDILCHIDAYRVKSGVEAYEAGLCEYIGAPDCITIIEWHQNIADLLSNRKVYRVSIESISENKREIIIYDK